MPNEPLWLLNSDGERWSSAAYCHPFAEAAKAARSSRTARRSIACGRPRSTWALLAGVPIRLVASLTIRVVAMIERTNRTYIAQRRRPDAAALFDVDVPSNIMALVR